MELPGLACIWADYEYASQVSLEGCAIVCDVCPGRYGPYVPYVMKVKAGVSRIGVD